MTELRGKLIGHYWRLHQGITPSIIAAVEHHNQPFDPRNRIHHPFWVLDYGFGDSTFYRVHRSSAAWQRRLPHSCHLYVPNISYWENWNAESKHDERHGSFLIFRGGEQLGLQRFIEAGNGHAIILDTTHKLIDLMLEAVRLGQELGESSYAKAQSILWDIAYHIGGSHQQGPHIFSLDQRSSFDKEMDLVAEVEAYFVRYLNRPITLKDLANHLHVTEAFISYQYKKRKGNSPMTSLMRMRIEAAKTLLLKGYRLKMIAHQTGFTDAFHLSHAFKKIEGISPRVFLRTHYQDGENRDTENGDS